MPRRTKQPNQADRLADLIQDAYLSAYVAWNPFHDNPEFKTALKGGQCVYRLVALNLLEAGVTLPASTDATKKKKASKKANAPSLFGTDHNEEKR
jgi:hypothetical protein